MDLARKRIVVGMTGGIAAYKVCELVRRLQDEGAEVQVLMTTGARQFVSATTMQALSGRPVFTEQWGDEAQGGDAMPHINLTRGVDAIVVAPATAHFIAKAAQGLADDLLSTLVLARNRATTSLLVAPAIFVLLWSTGWLAARAAMPYSEPLTFLTLRYVLAAVVLAAICTAMSVEWPKDRRQLTHAVLSGIPLHAMYFAGVWWSVMHGWNIGFRESPAFFIVAARQPQGIRRRLRLCRECERCCGRFAVQPGRGAARLDRRGRARRMPSLSGRSIGGRTRRFLRAGTGSASARCDG